MVYSVQVDDSSGGYTSNTNCTGVYRSVKVQKKLLHPSDLNFPLTGWEIFQRGLSKNPDAPCFGRRTRSSDGCLQGFEFKTYAQVENMIKIIGSKILQFKMIEPVNTGFDNIKPCNTIGIYSSNSVEWLITEQICNAYSLTLVPLYDTLGNESVIHIIGEAKCKIIVIESKYVEKLLKILESESCSAVLPKILIITGDKLEWNVKLPIRLIYWDELLDTGSSELIEFKPAGKDMLNTISYTSGTSGTPKGVMVTQEMIACSINSVINGVCKYDGVGTEGLSTYLSYLPLAHLYERLCVNSILCEGGKIGVYSGNVKIILDDAKELKPTVFTSVPRVYQKIFDSIMNAVSEKSFLVRGLFRYAWNSKLSNLQSQSLLKHPIWDALLFNKFKRLLGGEIKWMLTGSAPLNPEVLNSLKVFFGVPIINAYGLTECTACGLNQIAEESDTTHIGGPILSIEFKLASVPDLEYLVTDKPNPRGELCLRGYNLTKGYFNNPALTAEHFIDGWFYTGDIAELLPNGAVKIIDRSKCIFKLAQGEYISPERLENIFIQSHIIAQAYVTGRSDQCYPVAIFVLDREQIDKWLVKNNDDENLSFEEACKTDRIIQLVREEIDRVSTSNGIKGFEKIHSFHLETEPFTPDNNLLTPTLKLRRFHAAKVYKDIIDQLYQQK